MDAAEVFIKTCGEVGNFTERLMGTSIVDAYFGPPELAPPQQTKDKDADTLLRDLDALSDSISESISDSLRCAYLLGEVNSLRAVVKWLAGESKSYSDLVRSIFSIDTKKFPDGDIEDATADLDTALSDVSGNTLRDRVVRFTSEGEVVGDELTALIMGDLQNRTEVVGRMFEALVHSKIGECVIDNGVEYQTVSDVAWSGYNYYQGGYKSINQFNTDRTFNKHTLASVVAESGGDPIILGLVDDTREALEKAVDKALAIADLVAFSGGPAKALKPNTNEQRIAHLNRVFISNS